MLEGTRTLTQVVADTDGTWRGKGIMEWVQAATAEDPDIHVVMASGRGPQNGLAVLNKGWYAPSYSYLLSYDRSEAVQLPSFWGYAILGDGTIIMRDGKYERYYPFSRTNIHAINQILLDNYKDLLKFEYTPYRLEDQLRFFMLHATGTEAEHEWTEFYKQKSDVKALLPRGYRASNPFELNADGLLYRMLADTPSKLSIGVSNESAAQKIFNQFRESGIMTSAEVHHENGAASLYITAENRHKGAGIVDLSQLTGRPLAETAFIGNSGNDWGGFTLPGLKWVIVVGDWRSAIPEWFTNAYPHMQLPEDRIEVESPDHVAPVLRALSHPNLTEI